MVGWPRSQLWLSLAMARTMLVAQLLAGFMGTSAWANPSNVPSSALGKPTASFFEDVHGSPRSVKPITGQVSFKTKTRNGVRGKRRCLRVMRELLSSVLEVD